MSVWPHGAFCPSFLPRLHSCIGKNVQFERIPKCVCWIILSAQPTQDKTQCFILQLRLFNDVMQHRGWDKLGTWVLGQSQCHSCVLRPVASLGSLIVLPLPFTLYHLPPVSFLVLSPFINHSSCLADFILQSCVQLTAISFFRSLQRSIPPVNQELLEKKYPTVVM